MNARRPPTPSSSRAPAGRPDAPRSRSTKESTRETSAQREAGATRGTGASSRKPFALRFTTGGDRTVSVSWRVLVGVLVATMAFVLVAPTLNLYFQQMEQERALTEQIEAAKERNARLEREVAMWEDPDFVRSQARDRLGFVVPGEQPWVVVDPEAIIGEDAQEAYQAEMGYTPPVGPWYLEMWASVETAGGTELAQRGRQVVPVTVEEG